MSNYLTCPYDCGGRQYKTISGGKTRCCNREVVRINGGIYERKEDAPEWRVLQRFINGMRKRLPHYDIPYQSSSYREILPAISTLLKKCGQRLELALEVVSVAFESWPKLDTFYAIISRKMFPTYKAKAQKRLEVQQRALDVESYSSGASSFQLAGDGVSLG